MICIILCDLNIKITQKTVFYFFSCLHYPKYSALFIMIIGSANLSFLFYIFLCNTGRRFSDDFKDFSNIHFSINNSLKNNLLVCNFDILRYIEHNILQVLKNYECLQTQEIYPRKNFDFLIFLFTWALNYFYITLDVVKKMYMVFPL